MLRLLLVVGLLSLLSGVPVSHLNIHAPSFVPTLKASGGFLPIQDLLDSPIKLHHLNGKEVEHYLSLLFVGNHGLQANQRAHTLNEILNDPNAIGPISRSFLNDIFNKLLQDETKTADLVFLQDSMFVQAKLWNYGSSDNLVVAPSELITYLNKPDISSETKRRVRAVFLGSKLSPEDIYKLMFHSDKATNAILWRGLDFPFAANVKEALTIAARTGDADTKNQLSNIFFQGRLVFLGPNTPATGYVFTNLHDFGAFLIHWKDFSAHDATSLVKFFQKSERLIFKSIVADIAWSETLEELLVVSLIKMLPYPLAVNEFLHSPRFSHVLQAPKVLVTLLEMSATSAEARRDLALFLKNPKIMSLIPQNLRIGLLERTKFEISARNNFLTNEFLLADLIKNQLYTKFRKEAMEAKGDLSQFLLSQEHHDALTRTLPLIQDSPIHNWLVIEGVEWILTYWNLFIAHIPAEESGADLVFFSAKHVEALHAAQAEASHLVLLGRVSDSQLTHLKSLTQKWLDALLELAYKDDHVRSLLKSPTHQSILPTMTLFGLDTKALHWFLAPSAWGSHPFRAEAWIRPILQHAHV
jgi:hypothetical protein